MKQLEIFLKGLWIGGTMTVPGVSGGTMAILLGIYDRLIGAVSSFFKKIKENLCFLGVFLSGAGIGMLVFAKLITKLLEQPVAGSYLRFFFLGAVAGGVPLIFSSAGVKRFSAGVVLYPLFGAGLVLLLALLPEEMFSLSAGGGVLSLALRFAGGMILAVALVLPGISASQMLFMLGIYEDLLTCIGEVRILPLVPLLLGTAVGILFVTRALETLMKRFPKQTFSIIFGFILGSLPELFPKNAGGNSFLCGLAAVIGFLAAYFIGKKEKP